MTRQIGNSSHSAGTGDTDPYKKFRVSNFPQTDLADYIPVDGIEIKFLDGCNRSCTFCVNSDFAGKPLNAVDADLFMRSLTDWLDDETETEKPLALYGTGGEPLMVLDLVERIFRPVSERGLVTRLVTNGTLLDKRRVQRLVDMKLTGLKVTFNTAQDARLIALMRGSRAGDAQRILDNIKRAKDAGLWLFVRIGLGKHNQDEAVRLYHTLHGIGVDVVQIKPWIPSGMARTNQEELSLDRAELFALFQGIADELSVDFNRNEGPELTVSCYPPARDLGFSVKDCANVAKIYCEPGGNAGICNFADEHLGSWYPEEGGLLACVRRRRELYDSVMDKHGVASCPARYNWSKPSTVVSPSA